jgi:stearoyl-CoA desaturase (delta-9 desaturase)
VQLALERPVDSLSPDAPPSPDVPRAHASESRVWLQRLLTGVIVVGPLAALAYVVVRVLGGGLLSIQNVALAAAFYLVTALGVTVGFHRLFTHHSFEARRPLKISLAIAGSMSFQGSIIGWVAAHRRHHMFSDRAGDPHSPVRPESQRFGRLRGLAHAHLGWFFQQEDTSRERFAPDLLADRDLVLIDRLFVPFCVVTLALPFALGYLLTGSLGGALAALLVAGVLRVALLHHVTWSTNSVCHTLGRRPFRAPDASTNFAPLAVLSMGESWHNAHHAFPSLARHGVDRHQLDLAAEVIRVFERIGWATRVRWPDRARLDARRVAR